MRKLSVKPITPITCQHATELPESFRIFSSQTCCADKGHVWIPLSLPSRPTWKTSCETEELLCVS